MVCVLVHLFSSKMEIEASNFEMVIDNLFQEYFLGKVKTTIYLCWHGNATSDDLGVLLLDDY